jgi:hypothetical protein
LRLADPKFEAWVAALLRDLDAWRRRIDADDAGLRADVLDREGSQTTGAAADVEHPIAVADAKQRDQFLAMGELRVLSSS